MLQDIGNSKESVSTRAPKRRDLKSVFRPLTRIKVIVIHFFHFHILAFPVSNLSYIAFSNSVIIFPVVTSPGGFT